MAGRAARGERQDDLAGIRLGQLQVYRLLLLRQVLCDGADPAAFGHACDNPFGDGKVAGINDLGNFVGAQIAGFNANEVAAAVPEPSTYVLLLAGLGLIGLRANTCRSKSNL